MSSRGKSIWVPIFSVQFCTGTPLFPCFDVLTEAKSSTQEPNRRDFEDFLKSIYMSMTAGLTGSLSPHLCASRLFALVPENITLMYGSVQFSRWPLWHTDEWDQLLGTTAGVHLVPVREQSETWNHKEDDYNHSSYTTGYWQAQKTLTMFFHLSAMFKEDGSYP